MSLEKLCIWMVPHNWFLNSRNDFPWKGLVMKSATTLVVEHYWSARWVFSIWSMGMKYWKLRYTCLSCISDCWAITLWSCCPDIKYYFQSWNPVLPLATWSIESWQKNHLGQPVWLWCYFTYWFSSCEKLIDHRGKSAGNIPLDNIEIISWQNQFVIFNTIAVSYQLFQFFSFLIGLLENTFIWVWKFEHHT